MNFVEQPLKVAQPEGPGLASFPEASHTERQRGETDFEGTAILHMDMLYDYAVWVTESPDIARDLLRETYLRACRRWGAGERCKDVRTWMFQLMRSQIAGNSLAGGETQPRTPETEGHFFLAKRASGRDRSLSKMIEDLPEDLIARAVRSLPETYRTVIILCDIQGRHYSEISELLECTVDEAGLRIHRARQLLRSVLLD